MSFILKLSNSLSSYSSETAFFINENSYSYSELSACISGIRKSLKSVEEKNIALIANDDLETYASIIATWFEGKFYIPLNPDTPAERNLNVLSQADVKTILTSKPEKLFQGFNFIITSGLSSATVDLVPTDTSVEALAYLLFTSGTTGIPKGVPITIANLDAFVNSFDRFGINVSPTDKVLQMFELTFDLSVMSYLVPLLHGASAYTIPKNKIKYSYIFELMDEHHLTIALMVPSIIQYLRPYFGEINCPKMRFSLFCGEALPEDVTLQWSKCLPNARILNVYGPTENTIFCTSYELKEKDNKTHNGILSIGKPMPDVITAIFDETGNNVKQGKKGELCLAGKFLTPGYWKNDEKNKESFFESLYEEKTIRFYRTGDVCYQDSEGDIMYLGRVDSQAKIQGYRVELSEVEHYAKQFLGAVNAVAVAVKTKIGNVEIGLCIESGQMTTTPLLTHLKNTLPPYMIPTQIRFIDKFPLNTNGKTDRKAISNHFAV